MRYSMLFVLLGIVYSARFESQVENQLRKPATNPASAATLTAHQATTQTHRHTRDVPAPTPSPSPAPTRQTIGDPSTGPTEHTHRSDADSANLGSLLVMKGDEMGIRVGSSETNVISMRAMGAGTSSQPSSGPMYMHHWIKGEWLLMFHYNLFAGVNQQGGPRGVTKFESTSWFMPMAYRKLGNGTLQLRGMFSAEPFTVPPGGSPLLFQTGETYKDQPLIDHQHPHDLFMELSAQYTLPLGERGTWFTYFGYPGEPALGPVTVFHRGSASENPSATLAHHLQDSTHISFGVLTTGFTYRQFKLEASIFNGREPDESRYGFDAHKWNSRSARLWFMPNRNWAFQISHAFLRSPENHEPDVDIHRTTASVQYNKRLTHGDWASAFVWGRNHVSKPGETRNLNGYTAESTAQFLDKNYVYTRIELVDKDELLRAADRLRLGLREDHTSFRIGAYTFGGVRDVWTSDKVRFGIGSDLTFYSMPSELDPVYGKNPISWKLFFRIRPGKMTVHSSHGRHSANETVKPID